MFRIQVKTIQDTNILTFTVDSYEIVEGDFVRFLDKRYNEYKLFHASRCEIKEILDEDQTDSQDKKHNSNYYIDPKKNGGWK
jgi:non-homologous end joining protein Ku